MALWKDIAGYEGLYIVSDEGVIVSLPRIVNNGRGLYERPETVMKTSLRAFNPEPYEFVVLTKDGKSKSLSVHRIVAEAFCEKSEGCNEVNHIDENTLNNRADNLEWCSRQYNIEYSKNKPVQQFDEDGDMIAEYKSIKYASEITGIRRTCIDNCLNGWSKSAGGYVWKYKERE